ncbi:gamma-glutamylcyclotransferase [Yoonia sp. SS1-5]|uniref:glutathione-specific gamma-glutamylcyclotransferase n=1 Tax=Yoonia rhodophyticola TaxID=3137370 RepID=A0AAN0NLZ7_9RHOB
MTTWVFAYGSLLWNPGFTPTRAVKAHLHGYHRSFCMLSIHHRGSEDDPGLVLALDADPQAQCTGMAFEIPQADEAQIIADIRERELISSAYFEQAVDLTTDDGKTLTALTYIINRDHRQYCQYDLEKQALIIAKAIGGRGPNTEYLFNTAAHIRDLGIDDPDMDWLATRVRALTAT